MAKIRDWKKEGHPNPGSEDAIGLGCTCPVLDNCYGEGINGSFWHSGDCPLHGQGDNEVSDE